MLVVVVIAGRITVLDQILVVVVIAGMITRYPELRSCGWYVCDPEAITVGKLVRGTVLIRA